MFFDQVHHQSCLQVTNIFAAIPLKRLAGSWLVLVAFEVCLANSFALPTLTHQEIFYVLGELVATVVVVVVHRAVGVDVFTFTASEVLGVVLCHNAMRFV